MADSEFETIANLMRSAKIASFRVFLCYQNIYLDYAGILESTLTFYVLIERLILASEIRYISRSQIVHTHFLLCACNAAIDQVFPCKTVLF